MMLFLCNTAFYKYSYSPVFMLVFLNLRHVYYIQPDNNTKSNKFCILNSCHT